MVKEVASKTSDAAGDGTTTATLLASAIFNEGLRNVTAGANPISLQRGIQSAVRFVVEELQRQDDLVVRYDHRPSIPLDRRARPCNLLDVLSGKKAQATDLSGNQIINS